MLRSQISLGNISNTIHLSAPLFFDIHSWFLAKAKSKELQDRKKAGENVKDELADMAVVEFRYCYKN